MKSKQKWLGKSYRVYDNEGNEIEGVILHAKGLNEAEKIAKKIYGPRATVEYTEV